jgi:putative PIN family toxin of toxin-antitoxin system
MIKAVLDVNILISGLFWKGPSRCIIDLAITHHIESVTSPDILAELEAVLYEDFSDIPYNRIEEIIRDTLSYSRLVAAERISVKGLRDIKDTKIIACALSGKAEYIVTGDKDLLVLKEYKGVRIITPKAFLDIAK